MGNEYSKKKDDLREVAKRVLLSEALSTKINHVFMIYDSSNDGIIQGREL